MDIDNYLSSNGTVSNEELKKIEVIAFYFSAHWCNPCRDFTPILTKFYDVVNKKEKRLEIVFISHDET